jgi:hypothetical protein
MNHAFQGRPTVGSGALSRESLSISSAPRPTMPQQINHQTVRDLLVEALAMKSRGVSPRHIADSIVGLAKGFGLITERGYGEGIRIIFHQTGEGIRFDGREWHHVREIVNPT